MAELPSDVAALARRLADSLERSSVPYAVGGAIALGHWALPRATSDVDLNVFAPEARWPDALAILEREGVAMKKAEALASLRDRGSCRLVSGDIHVDVFVPSIEFYDSVQARIVLRPLLGRPAWFLTAEDLAVFKMLFFRAKDLVDVRYMLATRGPAFDRSYVRGWLVRMLGEPDERVSEWDRLCREVPAT